VVEFVRLLKRSWVAIAVADRRRHMGTTVSRAGKELRQMASVAVQAVEAQSAN